MKIEDTNLVLLQKEFPKLVWYKDTHIYKGVSDCFAIELLFECQLWNCLEMAIDGTKEFIKEVSKAIIDLI